MIRKWTYQEEHNFERKSYNLETDKKAEDLGGQVSTEHLEVNVSVSQSSNLKRHDILAFLII